MIARLKPKSEFSRNVLTLMLGTTAAQAIPIAISPILTRMYGPDDFGIFALYISIVAILSIAATGRYELAVMLPDSEDDADILVKLSIGITLIFSFFLFLIIVLFNTPITLLLGNPEISFWLYIVPVSVFLTGTYNTLNYWLNRKKYYLMMSKNRVLQSTILASSQVSFGWGNISGGLMLGTLLGHAFSSIILVWRFATYPRKKTVIYFDSSESWKLAQAYKHHPMHLLPSHWVGTAAMQFPIFIISNAFGAAATGFYFMAQRLISLPTSIIANAIGDVYRQKASVEYREKSEFRALFLKTLFSTIKIAVIPFLILYFVAPSLFALIFGESWRVAGEYAQIIIISAFFQFVFTPVDKGALIVSATAYIFIWNVMRLLLFILLFGVSVWFQLSIEKIIWLIALINISLYAADGLVEYKLSMRK